MLFVGALLLERQDRLPPPRRRRLACSAQASRRLRSPTPPGLPRALSDMRLHQDGLDALLKPQLFRGLVHLRARSQLCLTCTRLCFQMLSVCPELSFGMRIGSGLDLLMFRQKKPMDFNQPSACLHLEPGRPSRAPPWSTSAGSRCQW